MRKLYSPSHKRRHAINSRKFSGFQTQREILKTLAEIRDQNKAVLRHNERSLRLGKVAERGFFGFAATYYSSQFLLHFFDEEFLKANPEVKNSIMVGSLLLGLGFAFPDVVYKFRACGNDIVRRAESAGQRALTSGEDYLLDKCIDIYFGFKKAGGAVTTSSKNIQRACLRAVKKILGKEPSP